MHTLEELLAILKLKQSLGIPLDEGSCFGVTDTRELRPAWQIDTDAGNATPNAKEILLTEEESTEEFPF